MATRKSTPKKTTTKRAPQKAATPKTTTPTTLHSFSLPAKFSPNFVTSVAIVVLAGLSLFFLAQRYRGLVIAGVVNKTPITRWQLNKVLTNRYGEAVLEELVNNELLNQEAAKQGIVVSSEDLAKERQSLVDSLGGEENLASALQQYGLTESDLTDQIRLRIIQEQLADKLFTVDITDEQVQEYFDSNESLYEGQSLDEVKEDIRNSLKQQQVQQEFYAWFDQLKQNTQIKTYLD